MAIKAKKVQTGFTAYFYKEVFMTILAIMSVILLLFEYIYQPSDYVVSMIFKFDVIVAIVFLIDFLAQLFKAPNKSKFLKRNWYLLLASIPIVEGWAELLRGLRVLELFRLVRAAEHLHYVEVITVGSGTINKSRRKHSK